MINNKELYLELNELVDNGLNLTERFMNSDIEEKEKVIKGSFNEIIDSISRITEMLQDKQEKIVKKI